MYGEYVSPAVDPHTFAFVRVPACTAMTYEEYSGIIIIRLIRKIATLFKYVLSTILFYVKNHQSLNGGM
jgi:hypothetical protein